MTPRKDPQRRRRMTRVLVPITVLLLGAALSPFAGAATPKKPYGTDVSPHTAAAGTTVPFTFTLTNLAKTQMIGAANLTAPSGFTIPSSQALSVSPRGTATVVGDTIELRDIALLPSETATLTFLAMPASDPGVYTWLLDVRQANDFRGSGNSFSPDPANVNLMTTVVGVAVACEANEPCSGSISDDTTTAEVDVGSGGTAAVLTIALLPTDAISCAASEYTGTSATVDFNVTADDRTKTVTITLAAELVDDRFASEFEVCYSSPNGFIDQDGAEVSPGGSGLLPTCDIEIVFPPCVSSRIDNDDGSVSVAFLAPEGDPKGHI